MTQKTLIDMTTPDRRICGKLTVLCRGESDPGRQSSAAWVCRCQCGRIKTIYGSALRSGQTTSCGSCKKKQDVTGLICKAPGCESPVRYGSKGHCGMHHSRLYRHGSYDLPSKNYKLTRAAREKAREAAREKTREERGKTREAAREKVRSEASTGEPRHPKKDCLPGKDSLMLLRRPLGALRQGV